MAGGYISLSQMVLSFPGQLFGILKADFSIPALTDPEDMKDHFLREVRLQTPSDFDGSEGLTMPAILWEPTDLEEELWKIRPSVPIAITQARGDRLVRVLRLWILFLL